MWEGEGDLRGETQSFLVHRLNGPTSRATTCPTGVPSRGWSAACPRSPRQVGDLALDCRSQAGVHRRYADGSVVAGTRHRTSRSPGLVPEGRHRARDGLADPERAWVALPGGTAFGRSPPPAHCPLGTFSQEGSNCTSGLAWPAPAWDGTMTVSGQPPCAAYRDIATGCHCARSVIPRTSSIPKRRT